MIYSLLIANFIHRSPLLGHPDSRSSWKICSKFHIIFLTKQGDRRLVPPHPHRPLQRLRQRLRGRRRPPDRGHVLPARHTRLRHRRRKLPRPARAERRRARSSGIQKKSLNFLRNRLSFVLQIVSITIGDNRIGSMETGTALARAMYHMMRAEHYKVGELFWEAYPRQKYKVLLSKHFISLGHAFEAKYL